jgi:hypothetical protein
VTREINQKYAIWWRGFARLFDCSVYMVQAGRARSGFEGTSFCNFVIRLLERDAHRVDITADGSIKSRVVKFVVIVTRDADEEGMPIGHKTRLVGGKPLR